MPSEAHDRLIAGLAELARTVQALHERCAREQDVSPTLARLLGILTGIAPTMNELADLLGLDKSSTSGLVDRAQRRGLVRRLPSQLDRRSVRVRLTPEGRALGARIASRLGVELVAMLEPVPDRERMALSESLRAILPPR